MVCYHNYGWKIKFSYLEIELCKILLLFDFYKSFNGIAYIIKIQNEKQLIYVHVSTVYMSLAIVI